MKNQILLIPLFLCLIIHSSIAQENSVTINGGYVFSNIEEVDEGSTGWRINALYEYTGMNEHLSHGLSLGYIHTEGTIDRRVGSTETKFKAGHWPIYYIKK